MKAVLFALGCVALFYVFWKFAKTYWSISNDVPAAENDWRQDRKQKNTGHDSGAGNYPESHGGEH